ncbi:hypothetical protein CCACVL1_24362 [Corchorus capsularis]|uniref:Uncharacterized protein n=1 Tax=Corchorus capsularis TaxID=210143 RepID=A0A1R3GPY2_COCAP|nr:hypothetical protein CCACVL1_24362 [Corchorus capsularis]
MKKAKPNTILMVKKGKKKAEAGRDGDGPSECDNQYHSDDDPVALSTG